MGRLKIAVVVPVRWRGNRDWERVRPRAHRSAIGYDHYHGMFSKQLQINRSLETFVFERFGCLFRSHAPRERRSLPGQRGATECQAYNERLCLAPIIRSRLRRDGEYSGPGISQD